MRDNSDGLVAGVDGPAVVRVAWLSGVGLSVTEAGAKSASLKTSGLYGQMPVDEKPALTLLGDAPRSKMLCRRIGRS